ncbi:lycopene beta cyclase [Synechococcus sp. MIT S9220]|uniref:lycopene beta cyclase n=1 Tax=unclassified Synechococcus TaxID=2626047 RepID=UPI00164CA380|nr:lycopene cyclase family protein [Synechococcus sp. MIT S9220]NOL47360.1 lycopene cyclase family protein [Synechococcus sp. MIT S9220]QNJ22320.1 lycopene beta cyclase [Synechococcus sp. MIT S9220]
MARCADVLVIGGGPAALCIASELHQRGVAVEGIALEPVDAAWPNTYGIWVDELKVLDLEDLIEHRWSDTVSYFGEGGTTAQDQSHAHGIDYGLFDRAALQRYWLDRAQGVTWHQGSAEGVEAGPAITTVTCSSGETMQARLVIDASGSRTPHIRRPDQGPVAGQAAYGVVGRFSMPPIEPGRFVLMDYRCDHLSGEQRLEPPTFLYAMDLGDGVFFVEETSLALAPGVPYDLLKRRLQQRLDRRGVQITEVIHEEFCLFPMNLPLPDRSQPVLAFGGAASMVHPASGYMVGSLLRRAPGLAEALAAALADPSLGSVDLARRGWQALWPMELVLRHQLYQFGLGRLMGFNERLLRTHFSTFFSLAREDWFGFLTNTLPLPRLMGVMLRLFALSPWELRRGLVLGAAQRQAPAFRR